MINKTYIEKLFTLWREQIPSKDFSLNFIGEESEFYRLNDSSLRQGTLVNQAELLIIKNEGRSEKNVSIQLTGDEAIDFQNLEQVFSLHFGLDLSFSREELGNGPSDDSEQQTSHVTENKNVPKSKITSVLEEINPDSKIVGLLTTGKIFRAHIGADDTEFKWFEVDRADVDYSIFSKQASVKEIYSSEHLESMILNQTIEKNLKGIQLLSKEKKNLNPGKLPVYLAPSAVNEVLGMFNWHGVQGSAMAEKQSVFMDLYLRSKKLSPLFNLRENFDLKLSPRFNTSGEISENIVEIIKKGQLISPLVSSTTHKKYGLTPNAANKNEGIRSGEVLGGTKSEDELISSLREGVYLSNLHYLNWSNKKTASITGMTRYGCYYVSAQGEISPINDMRFNVSLYDIFGDDLVDLSKERTTFCEAGTYGQRELGGMCVPGMLTQMTFTL